MGRGHLILLICLHTLLVACSARFRNAHPHQDQSYRSRKDISRLRQVAESWLGVPYRLGGDSRRGIDCSGLVGRIYEEVYRISLPRSAKEQRKLGYAVHPPYLQPGDLLFFRFGYEGGIDHVGIYLGEDRFIHASSTRGVVIDNIHDPGIEENIVVIRRVLR